MNPDRWHHISKLLEQALEREPGQRAAFLEEVCAGDEELRRELESLLKFGGRGDHFIEEPALEVAAKMAAQGPQSLIGQQLGSYQILSLLGAGGMGVVYKARDQQLGRYVAVKVLPAHLVFDSGRKKRFVQEARAASALNHPNIVIIYEIAHDKGMDFIVMEHVAGKTLGELIPRKGMRLKEGLSVAIQITDALAAAHAVGIVHRDLKPGNIMMTESGQAKVLDFGLAKLTGGESPESAETQLFSSGGSPKTEEGVLLGTVSYMSPEQAEGKKVDGRSDIFSFGSVLYELLAGQRPFTAKSDLLILQAILHSPPQPLSEIRSDVPYELLLVVEKALEKDPADRYQAMREMVVDLKRVERLKTSNLKPVVGLRPAKRRNFWILSGAGALVLIALAAWIWLSRRAESWENPLANAQLTRFTDFEGAELDAAISADGKFVAFLADRDGLMDAWVSQVGTGQFLNLTKGRFPDLLHEEVRSIGFSSDASQVWLRLFRSDTAQPGAIGLIPTMGGFPRKFLENGITAAWSPDGTKIVYHEPGPGDAMFIADRNGSNRRQLFADRPGSHCHHQVWSPDGRFIYFVRGVPVINATDIWRIPASGGQSERITRHNSRVGYPALIDGRTLLYLATAEDGSGPWLYSTDVERRLPHRVSFGLEQYLSLSSSADGRRLVAAVGNPIANLWTVPISDQIEKESSAIRLSLPTVRAIAPAYGPDFNVYLSSRGGPDGVWKFQDRVATELWNGSEGAVMAAPAVSPDGRQICFSVRKQDHLQLYLMTSDGTNGRAIAPSLEVMGTASWSPDGKWIAIAADEGKGAHLFKVPVGGGPPVVMLEEPSSNPVWSPNGQLIVYSGTPVGGSLPVKAVTMDGTPVPLPELRVLSTVGSRYQFLPDGKALVLLLGGYRQQNFWMIDVATGRQRQLTDLRQSYSLHSFAISPDGKQILFDRVRENSDIVLIELGSESPMKQDSERRP